MSSEGSLLAGQTAIVTGAARRLGRAVALALAGEGAAVVVHYHTSEGQARDLVEQIRSEGGEAWALSADLAGEASDTLVSDAADASGRPLDIVVNSAGVFEPSKLLTFSPEELTRNIEINALAPLRLARGLAAQERPAQVINMLDARIVEYDRYHAAYHLSKRMLFSLTRMLALELAPDIRVNAVAPGLILPPEGSDKDYLWRLARRVPLRRPGSTADVVRAVLFLLQSDYVTGQLIYLDGGGNLMSNTYGA